MSEKWRIAETWNSLLEAPDRTDTPSPRNHLWASELGGSMVDTFLKLHGQPFSNNPNERAYRKFEAGRFFENIVKQMFKRAGIFKAAQEHLKFQYPGLLEVTGYNDLRVGGKVDPDQAQATVQRMADDELITPKMVEMTRSIAEQLAQDGELIECPDWPPYRHGLRNRRRDGSG